jgi:Zn-dependent peptidase ImmA (M78 family)
MQQTPQPIGPGPAGVLRQLRVLVPSRPVSYAAALRLSDRLARRLIELSGIQTMPVPVEIVTQLPRIEVEIDPYMPALTSGLSVWDAHGAHWVISLNASEPRTRQRFTTLHEFFHIVVHNRAQAGLFRALSDRQVESLADYFAGCVLIPKRFLVRAWAAGVQRPELLAAAFAVSPRAVEVRLEQVHLTGQTPEFAVQPVEPIEPEVAR